MTTQVIVVLVVVGLIDAALLLFGLGEGGEPSVPPRPAGWDSSPEAQDWNVKAEEARDEQLTRAREASKNWGQTIATLLGVFATVAFIKGPESLDKVPGDDAYGVAALIAVAGVAAALAVYLAAIGAQGTPKQIKNLDGWRLKNRSKDEARSVAVKLRTSRTLALVAAASLLGAMGAAWLASLSARGGATKGETLVVVSGGVLTCGTLVRASDGSLQLKVGEETVPLEDVGQVIEVDSCPK